MLRRYKLFSLSLCLLMKSPVQFFPTGPPSSSSAKFRMILLVGGSPRSVRLLIKCINASSWGPESRCLYSEDAAAMETVSPFQRLRRVLSTRPCFVAVPLILGFSCDSKSARASSIGALVVELFIFWYCVKKWWGCSISPGAAFCRDFFYSTPFATDLVVWYVYGAVWDPFIWPVKCTATVTGDRDLDIGGNERWWWQW